MLHRPSPEADLFPCETILSPFHDTYKLLKNNKKTPLASRFF